jgi:hypothetical protein
MRRVLDHDPTTGVTTYFDYDQVHGQAVLTESQDVSAALRFAEEMRKHPEVTKVGMKKDLFRYAIVPTIIQYEMLYKHGVDFWRDDASVFKLLNTDYKRFKTTEIMHSIKGGRG